MMSSRVTLKLGVAFGALILILIGVGWLGLNRMARMNGDIQEVVDRRWHKVKLAREALRHSAMNSRITMQVFFLKDRAEIDAILEERQRNTNTISGLMKQIGDELESPQEKEALDAVWKARIPYLESYQRVLDALVKEDDRESLRDTMAQVVLPNLAAYHKSWSGFVEYQGKQMDRAGDAAEAHYISARREVFVLISLATLFAGGIAVFVTQNMTRETRRRLQVKQALREAHAELEKRVEIRTAELREAIEQLHASASQRAVALHSLQTSEVRFRMLSSSAPIGIFETDADGSTLYTNQRWQEITGLAPEDSLGDGWQKAVHPDDAIGTFDAWHRSAKERRTYEGEFRFCRACGEERWVHVRSVPVRDESGEVTGHVGTVEDITERKEADRELQKMHHELLETSRQAGMAEVATAVLHNVGNVLNSVNVASNCVAEGLRKSRAGTLGKVVTMLRENEDHLDTFFAANGRGRKVPGFLEQLSDQLAEERSNALGELAHLQKNIEHIKEIVAMQQTFSKVSGLTETLQISELVEDTLRLHEASFANHSVRVECAFEDVPPVAVEKHKVLQILVNLLRNARHACEASGQKEKLVSLRVANGEESILISVSDNGVGIAQENLARIFNHGFTTKKDGHGFGLHSGALAAREMGGALHVESAGPGQGATFTLELPVSTSAVAA